MGFRNTQEKLERSFFSVIFYSTYQSKLTAMMISTMTAKKNISAKTFLTQCNIKKKHQDTANLRLVPSALGCKRKSFVAVTFIL